MYRRVIPLFLLLALRLTAGYAGAPAGMVLIPSGSYTNVFKNEGVVEVAPFYLDVFPVSNGQFLEFVRQNPDWRKSRVPRVFADESYLAHWSEDVDPGPNAPSNSPVVYVSWFAARAYAKWSNKRLPGLAEWERAAFADERNNVKRILEWYGRPVRGVTPAVGSTFQNSLGAWDMHGLVWEWVSDFNTALVTGESRADAGLDRKFFCGTGSIGASSFEDYAAFMRYAFRSSLKADYTVANLGFRCAQDAEAP